MLAYRVLLNSWNGGNKRIKALITALCIIACGTSLYSGMALNNYAFLVGAVFWGASAIVWFMVAHNNN